CECGGENEAAIGRRTRRASLRSAPKRLLSGERALVTPVDLLPVHVLHERIDVLRGRRTVVDSSRPLGRAPPSASPPKASPSAEEIAPPGFPFPPRFPKYCSCRIIEFENPSSRSLSPDTRKPGVSLLTRAISASTLFRFLTAPA